MDSATPAITARAANAQRFGDVYFHELYAAVQAHPAEYGFPLIKVHEVTEKMKAAFISGSYNHDGRAIKATCKRLGIKYTRREIEAFLNGDVQLDLPDVPPVRKHGRRDVLSPELRARLNAVKEAMT